MLSVKLHTVHNMEKSPSLDKFYTDAEGRFGDKCQVWALEYTLLSPARKNKNKFGRFGLVP